MHYRTDPTPTRSAPMETHAFGFRLPANALDGQKAISYQSGPVLLPPPTSWWVTCLNSQLIEKLIMVRIATIAPRIARSASVGVRTVWMISAAIRNSRPSRR